MEFDSLVYLTDTENDTIRMCNTLYETANVLKIIRNLHEVFPVYEKKKSWDCETIRKKTSPVIVKQFMKPL